MGNLGPGELLVILTIALIVFGPKKLPEMGRSVGQALREFQRAKSDLLDSLHQEMEPSRPSLASSPIAPAETVSSVHSEAQTAVGEVPGATQVDPRAHSGKVPPVGAAVATAAEEHAADVKPSVATSAMPATKGEEGNDATRSQ